mmetsp:Transcript_57574/g.134909  ORF Transcript_57574/g.134909 Transcript_57574/m.134909 type:complete len:223 (-) Transcript_57574:1365-2033(-)
MWPASSPSHSETIASSPSRPSSSALSSQWPSLKRAPSSETGPGHSMGAEEPSWSPARALDKVGIVRMSADPQSPLTKASTSTAGSVPRAAGTPFSATFEASLARSSNRVAQVDISVEASGPLTSRSSASTLAGWLELCSKTRTLSTSFQPDFASTATSSRSPLLCSSLAKISLALERGPATSSSSAVCFTWTKLPMLPAWRDRTLSSTSRVGCAATAWSSNC